MVIDKSPEARPGSLENAAEAAITWRYIAPAGTTLDMIRGKDGVSKYFKNCLRELSQQRIPSRHSYNRIEILAEDGAWEAELRVMAIDGEDVTTRILRVWHDSKAEAKGKTPDGYKIEFVKGNGWRVLDHGNTLVAEKIATEGEAIRQAIDHAKKG